MDRSPEDERIGKAILAAAMHVHSSLGPGLLESAYEACLAYELEKSGLLVHKQLSLPLDYDNVRLEVGFRIDLLVGNRFVVEVKTVEKFLPIHLAQILSYLKLGKYPLGFLLNFNVTHMRQGSKRVVA